MAGQQEKGLKLRCFRQGASKSKIASVRLSGEISWKVLEWTQSYVGVTRNRCTSSIPVSKEVF